MDYSRNATSISGAQFNPTEYFLQLSTDFGKFHLDPYNVLFHLVTTPLGLIGALSLLRSYTKSSSAAVTLTVIYLMSLLPIVPNGIFAGTVVLSVLIVELTRRLRLGFWSSLALVVIGYALQDLAHLATGEKTFQSTYSAGGQIDFNNPVDWLQMFVEHCYYLLPLCVHVAMPFAPALPSEIERILKAPLPEQMQALHSFAWLLGPLFAFSLGGYCLDSRNQFCFFPGTPYFYRVLRCNIVKDVDDKHSSKKEDLKAIRDWTLSHNPSENTSSHWWYRDLTGATKAAFDRCATSSQVVGMFRSLFSERHYCLDVVSGMNEIYVTGPSRTEEAANSDNVFYTRHVDGPWGLVPFVSVYRCIVGMDNNQMITTHFPLANIGVNACEGDVLAFDFNREVHYITSDDSKKEISDKFRVTLKLHYCVYPRVLAPLGWLFSWLNVRYNQSFRALFLKTLNPASMYEHFLAFNVNFHTFVFDRLETLVGQRNIIYLFSVLALWRATGVYEVFFSLTSFLHYFRYISTFYIRKGIDFGSFKRDVLLFKTIALVQMFYHYFFPAHVPFVFDIVSILMIVAGYSVSMFATNAIGIDRTYFAAELGLVEPKWINQFPYGYIPHPMIVSQIVALLGLYKAAHFRAEWPYVVPIHVTMYVIHMLQEHFDIYKRYPETKVKTI